MPGSWKKSFRDVPPAIRAKVDKLASELIIVAATKRIPVSDVQRGLYAHLGIRFDEQRIDIPQTVVPPRKVGTYSARNLDGWEVKRVDLPKITKTFSWETPNFGDASTYGTHTHYQDREVYQREVFEPRHFAINAELLNNHSADGIALVKFSVSQVLDCDSEGFEADLLFCLNLLQENTGVADVYASDATRDDFIGTMYLDWEIFPPGDASQLIASFAKGGKHLPPEKRRLLEERIKLFGRLPVQQLIKGTNSFGSYIGALYSNDLVVFENMNYGNALYVLYEDWQSVSKRSRLELLHGTTKSFDRFVHTDGWQDRFLTHIQTELDKRRRRRL